MGLSSAVLRPGLSASSLPVVDVSVEALRRAPKVLLHDHLDGGLRPAHGRRPGRRERLRRAAHDRPGGARRTGSSRPADSGSLERYLETFTHTVGVMQTPRRCAGSRPSAPRTWPPTAWSTPRSGSPPSCTWREGLGLDEVVEAVLAGFREGRAAGRRGRPPDPGRRRCSPRCGTRPARWRSPSWSCGTATTGVVGFDIAGAEAGFPPTRHLDAFEYLRRENAHFTIHAGEAFGLPSIWEALQWCGADRLGHGVRIVDDIEVAPGRRRPGSAGWPPTSATSGSRWSCARRRTCRPARRRRSPSTRSGCWPGCGSGSPSTPTTG